MSEKSNYEKLAAINVTEHIEKKGRFNYLSWAWAVDQLLRNDPVANWVHGEPVVFPDTTMMVVCTVTAFGKSMTMHLPVLNGANKPIPQPNAFEINTSMMRCLVKAIALHGLGLYIYAGEDLPLQDEEEKVEKEKKSRLPTLTFQEAEQHFNIWVDEKIFLIDQETGEADNEQLIAAWGKKPSNVRTAITKFGKGEYPEQQSEVDPEAKAHLNSI